MTTDDGLKGEVSSVSVLRQMVKVLVEVDDEKEIRDYSVDQLKFKPKRRRDYVKLTAQELKELSALEDKEENPKLTMPNNLVYEQERLDELHRNGYFIIQDPKRFCFGMDAVLLSGFAKAKRGARARSWYRYGNHPDPDGSQNRSRRF